MSDSSSSPPTMTDAITKMVDIESFPTSSYNFVVGERSCWNLVNGSFNIVIGHRSGSSIINQNGQFIFGDDQDSGPFVVGETPKFDAETLKVIQAEIPKLWMRLDILNGYAKHFTPEQIATIKKCLKSLMD